MGIKILPLYILVGKVYFVLKYKVWNSNVTVRSESIMYPFCLVFITTICNFLMNNLEIE